MNHLVLSIIVSVLLMTPRTLVHTMPDNSGFQVSIEAQDEHIMQCIQTGLEVRTRLEFRHCRRRSGWFDHCSDSQLMTRSVQFDPVSESYRIVTDLLSDQLPPSTALELDVDKAQQLIRDFVIPASSVVDPDLAKPGKLLYLSVRLRGYCERDDKSIFVQIPYYLTLGMFRFAGFDTGWADYEITN